MCFSLTLFIVNLASSVLIGASLPDSMEPAQSTSAPAEPFLSDESYGSMFLQEDVFFDDSDYSTYHLHNGPFYTFLGDLGAPPQPETPPTKGTTDAPQKKISKKKRHTWTSVSNRHDAAHKRRQELLHALQNSVVSQKEMLKDLYTVQQRQLFYCDIIILMSLGYDIRKKDEDGLVCLKDMIALQTCQPQKHVAIAMFDALKTGWVNKFDVAFALSSQGYRDKTYHFFSTLEAAFIVAGVHPSRAKLQSNDGGDLTSKLTALWDKVLKEPNISTQVSLQYHRDIISQLHTLQKTNMLATLRVMHKEFMQGNTRCIQKKGSLRAHVCELLSAQQNTPIDVKKLSQAVEVSLKKKVSQPHEFRDRILDLAFEGVPIVYDSEKGTVMIAHPAPKLTPPPANTNLLTMIYEFVCNRTRALSANELTYFAHTMGYWRVDNKVESLNKKHLLHEIVTAKRFLSILGWASSHSCAYKERAELMRLRTLWTHSQETGTIPQEFSAIYAQIQTFIYSPEYAVLLKHIQSQKQDTSWTQEETLIKAMLIDEDLTERALQEKCKEIGIAKKKEFWAALKHLPEKKGPGRIIFKLDEECFSWDATSCFEEQDPVSIQADIFRIRQRCRLFSPELIAFIMRQRGFIGVKGPIITHHIIGLRVLGLWNEDKCVRDLSAQRHLLNTILKENDAQPQEAKSKVWRRCSIERMHPWITSGAMKLLWEAFLEEQDRLQERPPQKKRRRFAEEAASPQEIISKEIPQLKKFLADQDLWWERGD